MRKLLIVSPHFPPMNTPDMQRIRMSLPYFRDFGWDPTVLAVAPQFVEGVQDAMLLGTVPADVPVVRVRAIPYQWTRKMGWGSLALRALPFLWRAGLKIIDKERVDVVYFSTTMFLTMPLGRIWRSTRNTPFVLDMQDPWKGMIGNNDVLPNRLRDRAARVLDNSLEPWTMRAADGIVAVSGDYIAGLTEQYPWLQDKPGLTLPFGGCAADFEHARQFTKPNPTFQKGDGFLHGVYVGRVNNNMVPAVRIICRSFEIGLRLDPVLFSRVRLHFVGTDYAPADRGRRTVVPVAVAENVSQFVEESPARVSYFQALRLLLDADFLIVPGSDNPSYTASKIFPYILARKPLLAVFHENSSVVEIVRTTHSGRVCSFGDEVDVEGVGRNLYVHWRQLLQKLPFRPQTDWEAFAPYTARETAKRQCGVFDQVIDYHQGARR